MHQAVTIIPRKSVESCKKNLPGRRRKLHSYSFAVSAALRGGGFCWHFGTIWRSQIPKTCEGFTKAPHWNTQVFKSALGCVTQSAGTFRRGLRPTLRDHLSVPLLVIFSFKYTTLFLLVFFAWCVFKRSPELIPKCTVHFHRRASRARPPAHFAFPAERGAWGMLVFPPRRSTRVVLKKNHKWALNDFNLPARAQSERGKNNQHQFCQLSSLCLLSCSQLTQIQLLSKLNERPHNCLVNTFFFFFACWSLLLHPWDVLKDRTASLSPALRGNKHKVNNKLSKMFSQIPFMKTTSQRPALSSLVVICI